MSDCSQPCYQDCDGENLDRDYDAEGNPILIVCPPELRPECCEYDGAEDQEPDLECCVDGNIGVNTDNGTVTHICCDGEWIPFGGVTEQCEDLVCYDIAGWSGPNCFGGGGSEWIIGGVNVMDLIQCPSESVATCEAASIGFTCDYGNNPNPGASPDSWTGVPFQPYPSTTIQVTGDPADGWTCTRPSFRALCNQPCGLGGSGPYTLTFTLDSPGGGAVNFALWDSCTDAYLDVLSVSPTTGASVLPVNLGDMMSVTGNAGQPTTYTVTFADNGSDPCCMQLMMTSLGNFGGTGGSSLETVSGITWSFDQPDVGGDCCDCITNLPGLAGLLTANDPNPGLWYVDGSKLCKSTLTPQLYGGLVACNGDSSVPVITVGGGDCDQ